MKAFKCNLNGYIAVKLDDKLRLKVSYWRDGDLLEEIGRALKNGVWVDSVVLEPEVAEQFANHVLDLIDVQKVEKAKKDLES